MITQEPVAQTFPSREIAPPSHRRWADENKDALSDLKERFVKWDAWLQNSEALFQQYVYESQEAFDSDFRQHRSLLCALMADGEEIACDFLFLFGKNPNDENVCESLTYVKLLDQKLGALRTTFFKWHAPVEVQTDIPEALKAAVREVKAGQIQEMEDF